MIIDDLFTKKLTDMSQNDNLKFLPLRTSWHGMTHNTMHTQYRRKHMYALVKPVRIS